MKTRDKAILDDLKRFRCMTRDDIVDLHFKSLKKPVTSCNAVMKRLRRDGNVEVNTTQQQYIYFPSSGTVKKNSQKISHFLGILDVYKQLLDYEPPKLLEIEPKYSNVKVEPDMFTIWRRAPFFVEVQKSRYSTRVFQEKINRYLAYYHSREWEALHWQPKNNKLFPSILIITESKYKFEAPGLRVFQYDSIKSMMNDFK